MPLPLTTDLTTEDEQKFKQWYGLAARMMGWNPDPDAFQHHYDLRGAFMSGWTPQSPEEHGSSQFKTPAHPNRFVPIQGQGILDTMMNTPLGVVRTQPTGLRQRLLGSK